LSPKLKIWLSSKLYKQVFLSRESIWALEQLLDILLAAKKEFIIINNKKKVYPF
jgi:hypothetical protein